MVRRIVGMDIRFRNADPPESGFHQGLNDPKPVSIRIAPDIDRPAQRMRAGTAAPFRPVVRRGSVCGIENERNSGQVAGRIEPRQRVRVHVADRAGRNALLKFRI